MDSLLLWQQANFSLYVSAATLLYQSYLITRLNYPKIVFNISPSLDQILLNESLHNRQLTIDGLKKKIPFYSMNPRQPNERMKFQSICFSSPRLSLSMELCTYIFCCLYVYNYCGKQKGFDD